MLQWVKKLVPEQGIESQSLSFQVSNILLDHEHIRAQSWHWWRSMRLVRALANTVGYHKHYTPLS